MSILNYVTRTIEKEFVSKLVQKMARDLPPGLILEGRGKMTVNKITRCLEQVYAESRNFKEERRLGMVGRAVVANAFKWGLTEAGYPAEFVSMATEGLIVALSK